MSLERRTRSTRAVRGHRSPVPRVRASSKSGSRGRRGVRACVAMAACAIVAACVSVPTGYEKAGKLEEAAFRAFVDSLGGACASRGEGSFLAEVRAGGGLSPSGGADAGFQMEGAWSDGARAFEAQLISPLGEALAGFSLGEGGTRVTFAGAPAPGQGERLRAFVDVLAALGPRGLRRLSCGVGLLDLEGPSVFVASARPAAGAAPASPGGVAAASGGSAPGPWAVSGTLRVAGHAVTLESRVSPLPAGTGGVAAAGDGAGADGTVAGSGAPGVVIRSTARAGLFLSAGGDVRWRGVPDASGRARPRSLSILAARSTHKRTAREGGDPAGGGPAEGFAAELTFLEFD